MRFAKNMKSAPTPRGRKTASRFTLLSPRPKSKPQVHAPRVMLPAEAVSRRMEEKKEHDDEWDWTGVNPVAVDDNCMHIASASSIIPPLHLAPASGPYGDDEASREVSPLDALFSDSPWPRPWPLPSCSAPMMSFPAQWHDNSGDYKAPKRSAARDTKSDIPSALLTYSALLPTNERPNFTKLYRELLMPHWGDGSLAPKTVPPVAKCIAPPPPWNTNGNHKVFYSGQHLPQEFEPKTPLYKVPNPSSHTPLMNP